MLYKRDNEIKRSSYIKSLFANEDKALKSTIQSIVVNDLRPINVGADEAKLIQFLLKLHGSKTVVEVGTLVGYSTIWIARSLPKDGMVYSFERDERIAEVARNNVAASDVADKVKIFTGDAHEKLKEIEAEGKFDALFIDAEKSGYCRYLDWAEKNLRQGGLVIGDNTFLFGQVLDDAEVEERYRKEIPVMQEFNKRLADSSKWDGVMIPTVEGLTVAVKL